MSNLVPYQDIEKMAVVIAKSGLFNVKTEQEAMALMLIAQAEGSHPAAAARDYHVIQGRPALKADAMMARFQQAGGKVEWKEYTDDRVTGVFSHPAGGSLSVTWTIEMGKNIGLVKPGSGWHKYPRAMLRARCISEGIRSVYPGCVAGVYTPEEVEDMEPPKQAQEVNMGKAEVVVEEIKKAKERKEGEVFLPLYVPGIEEPFSESTDLADWETSFHDMVHKIKASQKLSDDTKRDKLKMLKDANGEVIDKLDAPTKMKVMAAANSLEEV
jgi:hypothetical protein